MSNIHKGAIVVGFIGQALAGFLQENRELVEAAKRLGGLAACRKETHEHSVDLNTTEESYRYVIEFATEEDAEAFTHAVRDIVSLTTERGDE